MNKIFKFLNKITIENLIDVISEIGSKNDFDASQHKVIINEYDDLILNTKNKEVIEAFQQHVKKLSGLQIKSNGCTQNSKIYTLKMC